MLCPLQDIGMYWGRDGKVDVGVSGSVGDAVNLWSGFLLF